MATRTKPLITAAALATAAAIAVASPAIAPNLTPTPNALSAAQVELTTFADLLSITPAEWNDYFYLGWGGAIGQINVDPQTIENDYWIPQCNYDCLLPGVSGLAYLGLDALINGNGAGIDNVAGVPNPNYNPKFPEGPGNYQYLQPGQPGYVAPWGTSALNYYFEGGLSTFAQYILQQPFAPGAPLANQQIFDAIKLAFQVGSGNLWLTAYVNTLSAIAQLAEPISEYLYRGIGSYLGSAFANIDSVYDYSYYAGWSGVFRYVGGVITTPLAITEGPLAGVTLPFGNPNPYPLPAPEPAAPAAALSSSVAAAKSVSVDTGTAAPVVEAEVAAPKAGETPSADSTPDDSTPAAGGSSEGTSTEAASDTTVPDTTVPDTKPADTTPAVDSPSNAVADSTADATPAAIKPADTPAATKPADAPAKAAKRPVRGAVERATKKIASAIGGSAAKAAPAAGGSADSGASAG